MLIPSSKDIIYSNKNTATCFATLQQCTSNILHVSDTELPMHLGMDLSLVYKILMAGIMSPSLPGSVRQ